MRLRNVSQQSLSIVSLPQAFDNPMYGSGSQVRRKQNLNKTKILYLVRFCKSLSLADRNFTSYGVYEAGSQRLRENMSFFLRETKLVKINGFIKKGIKITNEMVKLPIIIFVTITCNIILIAACYLQLRFYKTIYFIRF